MRDEELDRLGREIDRARRGSVEAYAHVLERALAACDTDAAAAEYLDVLELHSELADAYDGLGRVEDALRHADVLAEQGYACMPDPRCRRAEILTRNGQLAQAGVIWDAVARDTPHDTWVFNNAGLEYQAIGEHEIALSWLERGLELAVRTGDPERLIEQLRDLRASSLAALGREPNALHAALPVRSEPQARLMAPVDGRSVPLQSAPPARVVWAWLPAQEYAELPARWPDLADSDLVRDEQRGGLVSHGVYCRRMDLRLREAAAAGLTGLHIAPLRAAEFARWVAEHGAGDRDAARLRAMYAADLGRDRSRVIRWPPGRNEPCWCGSGRRYKTCCRSRELGSR